MLKKLFSFSVAFKKTVIFKFLTRRTPCQWQSAKKACYIEIASIKSDGILLVWRKKARDWLRAYLRRKRETFSPYTNPFWRHREGSRILIKVISSEKMIFLLQKSRTNKHYSPHLFFNKCSPIPESKIRLFSVNLHWRLWRSFWSLACLQINFASSRWDVLPTFTLLQWHVLIVSLKSRKNILMNGKQDLLNEKIIVGETEPKRLLLTDFISFRYLRERCQSWAILDRQESFLDQMIWMLEKLNFLFNLENDNVF